MSAQYRSGTDSAPAAAGQVPAGSAERSSAVPLDNTYGEPSPENLMGGQAPEINSVYVKVVGKRFGVTISQIAENARERAQIAAKFLAWEYEVSYARSSPRSSNGSRGGVNGNASGQR